MTDPLEDRLRSHLADRAAQVTVEPDPAAVVERAAGRRRIGAPLVAGVVAVAALVAGGSFATGLAVAGPSPASTTLGNGADAAVRPPSASVVGGGVAPHPGTVAAPVLTHLSTRTTDSGVTIRVYTSAVDAVTPCTPAAPCTPGGGVPPTVPCPAGAECAQPVTTPAVVPPAPPGPGATVGSVGASASSGSGVSGSPVPVPVPAPTTTTPPATSCRQLTVELSTAQAVWSSSMPAPTTDGSGPKTVQLVDTGSFGVAEGAPVGFAVVVVPADVASVRLVSSSGAVLDAVTPSSGVVVAATTDASGFAGSSVVGLDAGGATVATVPADAGMTAATGGCGVPTPVPTPTQTPTPVPTPTPVATVPGGTGTTTTTTTTTTGPTTSSMGPQRPTASPVPATRPG